VEPQVAVVVGNRDAADLGLSVDLFEIDTEGVEEAEHVRRQRCAAGVAPFDPEQAELVTHRA
jgi:hypothetical protein